MKSKTLGKYNLKRTYSVSGVSYILEPAITDWLANPYSYGDDSQTIAFLSHLERDGFAELAGDELIIPWSSIYMLEEIEEFQSTKHLLRLPEIHNWRPNITSYGSLSDKDFSICINGWIDENGKLFKGVSEVKGAVLRINDKEMLLPQYSWITVKSIIDYSNRNENERNYESNRKYWAQIRTNAIVAKAGLSDFLKETVVITAERLNLEVRKTDFGDQKIIEIIPTFKYAPNRWLENFDKFKDVIDKYEIPDGNGLTHVLLTPEVKAVLKEIKKMPGRRVAGSRAEALIRNPFSILGPISEIAIDPDEFEKNRINADLGFARFIAKVLYDERNYPYDISLLIEEAIHDRIRSEVFKFENRNILKEFINELESKIQSEAQCFFWEGFDLEILGDTPDQLDILKVAYNFLEQDSRAFTYSELFDLSKYSERIDRFGVEKPYYSPFIAKKNQDESWIPENITFGITYTPEGSTDPIAISFTKELLEDLEKKVQIADHAGQESILIPGCPRPIHLKDAHSILDIINQAQSDVLKGTFDPNKGKDSKTKQDRKGLVIKPNINTLDYKEERGMLLPSYDVKPKIPSNMKSDAILKDHQSDGVIWLDHLWNCSPKHCRGAVLADDMGLGKTVQLLTFFANLIENDPNINPILVVAPVSLLENWKEEIDKFFLPGTFSILTLYGSELNKLRIKQDEIDDELRSKGITRLLRRDWIGKSNLVLTTYETLRDLEFSLALVKWSIMICDEAQKIKNPNALVTRAAKKQNVKFKIACTGTPVENTLTDLWCLFDYVQPGLLGALDDFGNKYRRPIEAETDEEKKRVNELRDLISSQILRREKRHVAKDLPDKIIVNECKVLNISDYQRNLYSKAIHDFKSSQDEFKNPLGLIHKLRRICSDPISFDNVSYDTNEDLIRRSPKMEWLTKILHSISLRNEKVIIFCELRELQLKLQMLIHHHFKIVPDIISGDTPASVSSPISRQKRIKTFQEQKGFGVIILSPLAVGFGVNIQAANHVIHFIRTWNPAKEDQATDRAYRIGQTKDVYVYYPTITAHDFITFDVKLDKLLEWKRALSADMLNGTDGISSGEFVDIENIDGEKIFAVDESMNIDLCTVSARSFEALCALIWTKNGYSKSYLTPHSNDGGVDVVAIREKDGVLIQCKTSSKKGHELGWEAIKDVVTGSAQYSLKHPGVKFKRIAVTNQFFNSNAHRQAIMNHVELVDQAMLLRMINEVSIKMTDIEFIKTADRK